MEHLVRIWNLKFDNERYLVSLFFNKTIAEIIFLKLRINYIRKLMFHTFEFNFCDCKLIGYLFPRLWTSIFYCLFPYYYSNIRWVFSLVFVEVFLDWIKTKQNNINKISSRKEVDILHFWLANSHIDKVPVLTVFELNNGSLLCYINAHTLLGIYTYKYSVRIYAHKILHGKWENVDENISRTDPYRNVYTLETIYTFQQ